MERMLEWTSRDHLVILLFLSQPIMSRASLKDICLRLKFPVCNANLSCCSLSSLISTDHEHEKGIIRFLSGAVFMYLNSISMFLFCFVYRL